MSARPGPDPDLARLAARPRSAAADAVAAVLDPVVVLVVAVPLVAAAGSGGPGATLGWSLLALAFVVGLPWGLLLLLVRAGRLPDRHVVVRRHRHGVVLAAAVSVAAGVAVLARLGAPGELVELLAAVLVGTVVVGAVTLVWKVSVHTAVLASAGVVLSHHLGPAVWYAVLPMVLLLGWARWRAGRHSAAQAVAGAVLGGASAALVVAPLGGP